MKRAISSSDLRVQLQTDIEMEDDLVEPGASILFKVAVIRAGEPSDTEFSVWSCRRSLPNRSTMSTKYPWLGGAVLRSPGSARARTT
jgi:hypothetical protein